MAAIRTIRRGTLAHTVTSATTPGQIANLAAWWKADALTGLSDSDPVGSWTDSSNNAWATVQSNSANKPTYKTGIVNGNPVVRFGGSAYMDDTVSASQSAQTIFAVARPTATTGTSQTIRGAGSSGGLQFAVNSGVMVLVKQSVAGVGVSSTTISTANFSVLCATFAAGSSYAFYLNGAADGSGSTSETLTSGTVTVIGQNGSSSGERVTGDLAELIIYDAVLSGTDRAAVTAYLGGKYGITVV